MTFAKTHINKSGKITELQRIDEYEIPLVAVREAISNAIVHRDYSISGAEKITMVFQDPEKQLMMNKVHRELAFGLENICADEKVIKRRVYEALQFSGIL